MYLLKGFLHSLSSVLKQLPGDNALYQKTEVFTQKRNLPPANAFCIEINQ